MISTYFYDLIRVAYKDLDHPDFSFAHRALNSRLYDPMLRRMRDYAAIEQCGAGEDDVCFSYLLKGTTALWKLDLSVVGPFGIFVRLSNNVTAKDFIHPGTTHISGFERRIVDLLNGGGIRLMTPGELSIPVPLSLFNTPRSQTCLYQALFSDCAKLPWNPDKTDAPQEGLDYPILDGDSLPPNPK